jgi:hypothetical protein
MNNHTLHFIPKIPILLIHLVLFTYFGVGTALALPQFPIRYGSEIYGGGHAHQHEGGAKTMDCRACHINPSGGGMRNEHGRQFAQETLIFPKWGSEKKAEDHGHGGHIEHEEKKEEDKGIALNHFLSMGGDFRFVYLHAQKESTSAYKDTFFPMQMDVYLLFHPDPRLSLFYQDGIRGSREAYGLTRFANDNAHLKLGKFLPPFGLKLDDHTSFVREKLGFDNTFGKESDAGIELGFSDEPGFGNIAVFNGTGVAPDDNRAKGISATGGIKNQSIWLAGSFFHNKTGQGGTELTKEYVGVYTAYRINRLAFLGEWDYISTETPSKTNGYAAFAEVSFLVQKGIAAKIKYDAYDPNQDSSGDRLLRYTLGVDLYPVPHTEVFIQYRNNREEVDRRNDQILVMTHLYF